MSKESPKLYNITSYKDTTRASNIEGVLSTSNLLIELLKKIPNLSEKPDSGMVGKVLRGELTNNPIPTPEQEVNYAAMDVAADVLAKAIQRSARARDAAYIRWSRVENQKTYPNWTPAALTKPIKDHSDAGRLEHSKDAIIGLLQPAYETVMQTMTLSYKRISTFKGAIETKIGSFFAKKRGQVQLTSSTL